MGTLGKHLPALLLLAIVGAFAGSLAADGAITGPEALGLFGAGLTAVGVALGVKIGTTASTTTPAPTPPPAAAAPAPSPNVQVLQPPTQQTG